MLPAYLLESNHVVDITYETRMLTTDGDWRQATITGFWTGKVEPNGMFEIMPLLSHRPLYLFADEIVEVEAL